MDAVPGRDYIHAMPDITSAKAAKARAKKRQSLKARNAI
jgi:hypothetical protein